MRKQLLTLILCLLATCAWKQASAQEQQDTIVKHDPAEYLSNTLPVLYINTENETPIVDKENYIQGTYYLDANGCGNYQSVGSAEEPLPMQIKGRGNTSWNQPKKPYRLKLDKKAALLGMPKSKHWVLLADYGDYLGHGKDYLCFRISEKLELPYTPRSIPIEVVLNGDYIGMYFLTEKIRIEQNRVDIIEQQNGETDPLAITGGWLLEIDNYNESNQIRFTDHKKNNTTMRVTYHSPDSLSQEQLDYITTYIHSTHNAVNTDDKTSTEWENFIDVDAIAKYYVMQEAIDNMWAFSGSCWFYKEYGDNTKLIWGPLWDTAALPSRDEDPAQTDFFYHETTPYAQNHWIGEIAKFPNFQIALRKWWKKYRDEVFPTMQGETDAFELLVSAALAKDYLRWGDSSSKNIHPQLVKFMRRLTNRCVFLGWHWDDPTLGITLSEMMSSGFDGTEYIVSDNLAVVGATKCGNRVFVTDGNNHWLQVHAGDYYNLLATQRSIATLKGIFTGKDFIPTLTLTDEPQANEATLTADPKYYELDDEFSPAVNEVIKVSGIYNANTGTLQAYDDDNDDESDNIEITLDTSWMPSWSFTNGQACTINAVALIKEPWPTSDTALNSFEHNYQNLTLFPIIVGNNGDVNGDGFVTATDVTAIYDILLGSCNDHHDRADVNGDGSITAADVTAIYEILLGMTYTQ